MVKEILQDYTVINGTIGTGQTFYKTSDIVLVNNTGKTPIRVDKVLLQVSGFHDAVAPMVLGALVALTDENGTSMADSVSAGSYTDANMTQLMNQWKENVFMTDFQWVGTGSDENAMWVSELAADTRRILNPGQKLVLTLFAFPKGTETSKSAFWWIDSIIWYSQAAQ